MPNPEIEEFARLVIHQVRDAAIRSCDSNLQSQATHSIARRWRKASSESTTVSVVIPDAVDETIFQLLRAVDQGALKLTFIAESGKKIDLPSDGLGELAGWYIGSGGWRAQYSQERFIDDFSDLA